MSEADWWICQQCSSLNNLSAGKCYSCQAKKPRAAARASHVLGYRVHESWDGKVSLEQVTPSSDAASSDSTQAPLAAVHPSEAAGQRPGIAPPPLREPVRRHILAVAPQPPEGARIVYAAEPPSAAAPAEAPLVAMGPGVPPTDPAPEDSGDLTGFPDDPTQVPGHGKEWDHWQDLLDGPTPDATLLVQAREMAAVSPLGDPRPREDADGALTRAMKGAIAEHSGPESDWPEADRHAGPPDRPTADVMRGGPDID